MVAIPVYVGVVLKNCFLNLLYFFFTAQQTCVGKSSTQSFVVHQVDVEHLHEVKMVVTPTHAMYINRGSKESGSGLSKFSLTIAMTGTFSFWRLVGSAVQKKAYTFICLCVKRLRNFLTWLQRMPS